jgi:hypothetical protein
MTFAMFASFRRMADRLERMTAAEFYSCEIRLKSTPPVPDLAHGSKRIFVAFQAAQTAIREKEAMKITIIRE